MKFSAKIERRGINPYVTVSPARAARIKAGWKRPMPVLIQVNGKPDPAWQVNMMPAGDGSFYLYLDGGVRKASGTDVGDRVEVSIVFDPAYAGGPQHAMLHEFALALDRDAQAKARWEELAPSLKKEVLRYLANLKSDEAR